MDQWQCRPCREGQVVRQKPQVHSDRAKSRSQGKAIREISPHWKPLTIWSYNASIKSSHAGRKVYQMKKEHF